MFLGGAVNCALVTLLYALFARGGTPGWQNGLIFGLLLGLLAGGIPQIMDYLLLLRWPFWVAWGPATIVEQTLLGVLLGILYKP